MKPIISCHTGSHDACFAVYDPETKEYYISELQKVSDEKHYSLKRRSETNGKISSLFLKYLKEQFGIDNNFSTFIIPSEARGVKNRKTSYNSAIMVDSFLTHFHADRIIWEGTSCQHHDAHAWSSYAISPFKNAFVIAYDGGGEATTHEIFQFFNNELKYRKSKRYRISNPYNVYGPIFPEIADQWHHSDQSGKFMALTNFGDTIIDEVWKTCDYLGLIKMDTSIPNNSFYTDWFDNGMGSEDKTWWAHFPDYSWDDYMWWTTEYGVFHQAIKDKWGIIADSVAKDKNFNREEKYNIAYTVQKWTENAVVNLIKNEYWDYIVECDYNLILTGGTALNILVNSVVRDTFPELNVFVAPNPNDSGLAFGHLYHHLVKYGHIDDKQQINIRYNDFYLFDYEEYKDRYQKEVTLEEISQDLKDGKIIGLLQGRCENGPRALGNRSILCDPRYKDMKDRVNRDVKFREDFRPFAPVCRKEDAHKWFEGNLEGLETMSYAVMVKEEFREKFPSITHVDGSARLQTVIKEDNPVLYDLLTKFDSMLLNTSFNVRGKPILNRIEHALKMVKSNGGGLDYFIVAKDGKFYLYS